MKDKLKQLKGWLRLKRKLKKKPLITIITVVFNGEKTLERTIQSVINQTYKNIEYIIIDGNSTDGTLGIIQKYNKKIDYWISEQDKGIYNAMNKGIKLAKGDYIYILGSDDYLYDREVLQKISIHLLNNYDLVYGDIKTIHKVYGEIIFPKREIKLKDIKRRKMPPHTSLFMKKDIILGKGLFNTEYKIASDYELICKCYLDNYNVKYIPEIIAIFSLDGTSSNSSNQWKLYREDKKIIRENFGLRYSFNYLMVHGFSLIVQDIFFYLGILDYYRQLKSIVLGKKTSSSNF